MAIPVVVVTDTFLVGIRSKHTLLSSHDLPEPVKIFILKKSVKNLQQESTLIHDMMNLGQLKIDDVKGIN